MLYNPECQDCSLHEHSRHICLYGKGNTNKPKVMFVGEYLGEAGDRQGRPIAGNPAKVFDLICKSLELEFEDIYVTNVIKCLCEDGKPAVSEIKACLKYLEDEIQRIQPELLVLMGGIPLKALLKVTGIDKNRRRIFQYNGIPTVATYNPGICFYKGPAFATEIADDIRFGMGDLKEEEIKFTYLKSYTLGSFLTPYICLDIETNNTTDPFQPDSEVLCVSVCNQRNEVLYFRGQEKVIEFCNKLIKKCNEKDVTVVGHNIKSDFKHLRHKGLNQKEFIKLKVFDTLVALSHMDENYPNKSLGHSCQRLLGVPAWKHMTEGDIAGMKEADRKKYNGLDVINNLGLVPICIDDMKQQGNYEQFLEDMETLKALTEIELNGMKVHQIRLRNIRIRYKKAIKEQIKKIPVANPNANQQIAHLLYNVHKLPILEEATKDDKTHKEKKSISKAKKEGKPWRKHCSTAEPILKALLKEDIDQESKELIFDILRYRALENTRNKFVDGWLDRMRDDGCLHGTYNLAKSEIGDKDKGPEGGTVTGRLGMKDPNLMQVPRERMKPEEELAQNLKDYGIEKLIEGIEHDWNVKRCIISRFKGGKILQIDADQAEMRGAANFSNDPVMIKIFLDGIDIHLGSAAEILDVPIEQVSKFQRKQAKTLNFGIIYGSSVWTMASKMETTKSTMQEFFDRYIKKFKLFWKWKQDEENKILRNGYAQNVFGRVRHLPGVCRTTSQGRAKLREGVNFLVQGPVAELTKYYMAKCTFALIEGGFKSLCIGNVHDAILFDIHPDEEMEVLELVNKITNRPHPRLRKYKVPFIFTKDLGPNWLDTKELEDEAA